MSIKKSRDRAQGRRKRLALVPVEVGMVPPAPPDLEPTVAADWVAFWQSEFARFVNWERDHRAFGRLFRLYSLEVRLEEDGRDTYLTGSQGQTILNPALRHLATVQAEILALEKQFGMTTQSAAGLGLRLGGLRKTLEDRNREANQQAARKTRRA